MPIHVLSLNAKNNYRYKKKICHSKHMDFWGLSKMFIYSTCFASWNKVICNYIALEDKMVFDYREVVSGHCLKIMEIGYLVIKIKSRSQHWNRLHIPKSYLEKWNNLSAKYCTIGHEDIPKISFLIWVTLYLNVYKYISNLKINFLIKKIKCNQYHNPEGLRTIIIHPVFIRHTHTLLDALSKCITI